MKKKLNSDSTNINNTQQISENELLFNQLFTEGQVGIVTADISFRILRANPAFCQMTGYSEAELKNKSYKDICHPEDFDASMPNAHLLLTEKITGYKAFKRYLRKDKEVLWCCLKVTAVKDQKGEFLYFLSIVEDITVQQKAEEGLRKFRMGIDNAGDAIFLTDIHGNIEFVNPAFEKMYGYSLAETVGHTPRILKSGLVSEEYYKNLWNNLLDKKIVNGEVINKAKDGHLVHIENSNTPILNDVGSIIGFISINRDVSERKRSEVKIKTLSKAIEQGPSSIIITNEEGKIEFVNNKYTQLTQYELSEVAGTFPRVFRPGFLPVQEFNNMWETLLKGETWNGESVSFRKDRSIFCEDISISALRDDKGAIRNFILIKNDITEKKQIIKDLMQAKEEAEKNERYYHSLFENMVSGFAYCQMIYEKDEPVDFIYHLVNPVFEPLTGLKDVKGRKVSEVIPGIKHTDTEIFHIYGRVARSGMPEKFEIYMESLQNWYSISVYSPQKDYFVAVFDVITERKNAEKALIEAKEKAEESDRLKSSFLANMSHELRTPLNSIIGFSDFMLDPMFGLEEHAEFAKIIKENGNNLLEIISNIMDLSKIESGQMMVVKNEFSLNRLIAEVHSNHVLKTIEKCLLWQEKPIHKEAYWMVSDESKIRQILDNLISNAIKFTESGTIEIGYEQQGSSLLFHVKDTGIGIPEEFHQAIFERFRQVETTNSRNYGGNGLGLAITKSLITLLGGEIWLESQPGVGSTFYFTIPLE
ncbi:MAG: PAS domain S-box protein [Candidatus Saccharibacteria bacterium]